MKVLIQLPGHVCKTNIISTISPILALNPPNPQGERKERSHGRLGKSKALARNKEPITICHENEEVYTSDFNSK